MSDPIEVLDFWLGDIGPTGWYQGSEALDAEIAIRFGDLWQAAYDGGLEHWVDGPAGSLAYLVICDQFSRNIHRGSPLAFATDAQARAAATVAIEQGWDLAAPEPERQFFYMPYEHSEDPADQTRAVTYLTDRLASDPEMALHARAHQLIIENFGRFPFRNVALGRASSDKENEFLTNGGYGALLRQLQESHATTA